jgi:outer membrane protein
MRLSTAFLVCSVLAAPVTAHAQLRLADALRRADSAAVSNRIASGQSAERAGQAIGALHGLLPTVRVEGAIARTTDPIGAFGTLLRQRRISQADFNPSRLNDPAPVTNYMGGLVAEVPLLNADAWLGRRAATRAADAGSSSAAFTRLAVRADVVRAFFGVQFADERVRALEAAMQSGAAHVKQAESMQRNGMVTPADALIASVKRGEIEADLAAARGDAANARRELGALLGADGTTAENPSGELPSALAIRAFASDELDASPLSRLDVSAAMLAADAARADAARARASLLPRVNGVARLDWNDQSRAFGGDKSWTVGVMATWTPFSGASELSDQRTATARAGIASAAADGAAARARVESARAASDIDVALQRLTIAERGAAQSADAHRIVTRRYEGGLASVVELLDAAAGDSRSTLMLAKAKYDLIAALAARRLVTGRDPAALVALDVGSTQDNNSKDTNR